MYTYDMCGAFQQFPGDGILAMLNLYGVEEPFESLGTVRPASKIQIVVGSEDAGQHRLEPATWWLLLEKHKNESGFQWKPNQKYKTFNTRSEGLLESRLAKRPYLNTRCLIPASAFMESNSGNYHHITNKERAIAFGGLYKEYENDDGSLTYAASIITLPAPEAFSDVHHRVPLMLDHANQKNVTNWLHKGFMPKQDFDLQPGLTAPLQVTPSEKYWTFEPKGETRELAWD